MVSVIVPVWNDTPALDRLLPKLLAEPSSPEIIVIDGGSSDDYRTITARYPRVRFLKSRRGRGYQMNRGAATARGDVLLFLHADTRTPRGAIDELSDLLANRHADFGAFRVRFDPPFWLLEKLAFFTRFALHWTCFGDQGIFTKRNFFEDTGGFPEIALLEDVHWLRKATQIGRMVRSPHTVVTSARRFAETGVGRQLRLNAEILVRDWLGTTPDHLATIYGIKHERDLR
jgi:rSAM/selenodomain-associated transferase 2